MSGASVRAWSADGSRELPRSAVNSLLARLGPGIHHLRGARCGEIDEEGVGEHQEADDYQEGIDPHEALDLPMGGLLPSDDQGEQEAAPAEAEEEAGEGHLPLLVPEEQAEEPEIAADQGEAEGD